MKRKLLASMLAIVMVISMLPTTVLAADFSDTNGHWGEAAIDRWADVGILNGKGDGNFDPNGSMTRAEFAQMLATMMGYTTRVANTFSDVPAGAWYEDAMLKLVAAGVLSGNGDGTATPNDPITREQAAVLLCRAFNLEPSRSATLNYQDSGSISSWARDAMAALAERGMMNGVGDNTAAPQLNINRASVATLADNMIAEYVTESKTITGRVDGIILVAGGASVNLDNATISEPVIIAPKASGVSVNLTGNTTADDIVIEANSARVSVGANASASSVKAESNSASVSVAGTVSSVDVTGTNGRVTVTGSVGTVSTEATGTSITVSGTVSNVDIGANAGRASVTASAGGKIDSVTTDASNVTVSGSGSVGSVTATGGSVDVTTKGTEVSNKGASDVTASGSTVSSGNTATSTGGSGSSGSGGGSDNDDNSGSGGGTTTTPPVTPPTTTTTGIESVSIPPTAKVGETLSANVTPGEATVTYVWQWSETSDGAYAAIPSATSNTYEVADTYENKYIKVEVTGTGSYSGIKTSNACGPIAAAEGGEITEDDVENITDTFTYNGAAQTPEPVVTVNSTTLTKGVHYSLEYANNINASTDERPASVTVKGIAPYSGEVTKTFTINKAEITGVAIEVEQGSEAGSSETKLDKGDVLHVMFTTSPTNGLEVKTSDVTYEWKYTVTSDDPDPDGSSEEKTSNGVSFTIEDDGGTVDGDITLTVTVLPTGNFTAGTTPLTDKVTVGAEVLTADLAEDSITYNGQDQKPVVRVPSGSSTSTVTPTIMIDGKPYDSAECIDAGTYIVTVTAQDYTGTVTLPYTIEPKALSDDTVTVSEIDAVTYKGSAHEPTPTVTDKDIDAADGSGKYVLQKGTDYELSYENNVNAGTAKVKITGKNNYAGSAAALEKSFNIDKATLTATVSNEQVAITLDAADTAKNTKTVTVTLDGLKGSDTAEVEAVSDNTAVAGAEASGTTITITGKTAGTAKVTVTVTPTDDYDLDTQNRQLEIEVTVSGQAAGGGDTGGSDGKTGSARIIATNAGTAATAMLRLDWTAKASYSGSYYVSINGEIQESTTNTFYHLINTVRQATQDETYSVIIYTSDDGSSTNLTKWAEAEDILTVTMDNSKQVDVKIEGQADGKYKFVSNDDGASIYDYTLYSPEKDVIRSFYVVANGSDSVAPYERCTFTVRAISWPAGDNLSSVEVKVSSPTEEVTFTPYNDFKDTTIDTGSASDLINALNKGGKVTLGSNIDWTSAANAGASTRVNSGGDVELDLNGHTITMGGSQLGITYGKTITIIDSSGGKTGGIVSSTGDKVPVGVDGRASLTLKGLTVPKGMIIRVGDTDTGARSAVIDGCTFNESINFQAPAGRPLELTVNRTRFTNTGVIIGNSNATFTDCTFSDDSTKVFHISEGTTAVFENFNFTSSHNGALQVSYGGALEIKSGTYTCNDTQQGSSLFHFYESDGSESTITITGGTFNFNPEKYLPASGYTATPDYPESGKWTVEPVG